MSRNLNRHKAYRVSDSDRISSRADSELNVTSSP
jgi:hypothetical protein